jgi:4-hydroxybenzoate polyprenyltransferase
MGFLQLIRYKNLIIIVLTLYLLRHCIVQPLLQLDGLELQLTNVHFFLLVMSTVFLTAAGYVINDYFDRKTDMVNRPDKVIVGRKIKRRTAMLLHIILNALGIVLGLYISYYIGYLSFGLIFMLIAGILWFYSTTYKRQFLIGNIIVAVLTGLVPLMVIVFEIPLLNQIYGKIIILRDINFVNIIAWTGAYGIFAFFMNLIREIIKDAEDFEGDRAFGRNSMPIVLGQDWTKKIITLLIAVAVAGLFGAYFIFLLRDASGNIDWISMVYVNLFLIVPLFYLIFLVIHAKTKEGFHKASNLSKVIMLTGILYMPVFRFVVFRVFSI